MGMEDYAVRLMPERQGSIKAEALDVSLHELKFKRLPLTRFHGGAQLSDIPQDEIYLMLKTTHYIIEAKIKTEPVPKEHWLRYVSIRFAVCQSPSVTDAFLEAVLFLAQHHDMKIDDNGLLYRHTKIEKSFPQEVRARIDEKKKRWHQFFGEPATEVPTPVEQAWASVLEKYKDDQPKIVLGAL